MIIYILFPNSNIQILINRFLTQIFLGDNLNTNNTTGFALYSNFNIAMAKFYDGFIIGTGFESHGFYYYKYIDSLYSSVYMYLNSFDAGSLYIRLFSEFGIIGFSLYFYFILKNLIKSKKNFFNESSIYSFHRITLLVIIFYGLRLGSYVNPLFLFSIGILITTNMRMKKKQYITDM
jgi:O-antigen ligase